MYAAVDRRLFLLTGLCIYGTPPVHGGSIKDSFVQAGYAGNGRENINFIRERLVKYKISKILNVEIKAK
jgi:hypothetical protein